MTEESTSLRRHAQRAALWGIGFDLFADVRQIILMVILVRLLEPSDYGVFALVGAIIGFIGAFGARNLLEHALQVRDPDDVDFQLHFSAGVLVQATVFLVANVVAGVCWFVPAYAYAAPYLHVASLLFVIDLPCELRRKMLEIRFQWRRVRVLHGIGLLFSGIISLILAWAGAGAYALIVPTFLATLPFMLDLFARADWRPTWTMQFRRYREAVRFGLSRLGSALSIRGKILLEAAAVVAIVGYGDMGVLGRAIGLGVLFAHRIAFQLSGSVYPVLTRIGDDPPRFERAAHALLRTVAFVAIPAAVVLAVASEPVVNLLYGAKWDEVIPLLPYGMAAAAVGALSHVCYMVLLAHHGQAQCLRFDLLRCVLVAAALFLLPKGGIHLYVAGIVGMEVLGLVYLLGILRARAVTAPVAVARTLWPGLAASAIGGAVAWYMLHLVPDTFGAFARVAACGLTFTATYALALRLLFPSDLRKFLGSIPGGGRVSSLVGLRG